MRKKVMASAVACTLILGTLMPAWADTSAASVTASAAAAGSGVIVVQDGINNKADESKAKITKDQAKDIAVKALKDYFEFTVKEKGFQNNIQFRQDYDIIPRYVWQMDWNYYNAQKNISANVVVDATTGKVLSINKYENSNTPQPPSATITQEDAKETAEDFLKKVNPNEFKMTEYINDYAMMGFYGGYRPTSYNFRYARLVNGIQFENDSLGVDVDCATGKITGYYYRWNDTIQFPAIDKVISKEKAEELFKQTVILKPGYLSIRDQSSVNPEVVKNVKIVYMPDMTTASILDAQKGEMVDFQGNTNEKQTKKDLTADEKAALMKDLKTIAKLPKELDSNQAMAKGQEYIKALYGDGYEIQYSNYFEGTQNWYESRGKKIWMMQFNSKTPKAGMMNEGGNVTIDAETGALVSAYKYMNDPMMMADEKEKFTPAITWEQAYMKAFEAIKTYFPDKLGQITTEQIHFNYPNIYNGVDLGERSYNFNFIRLVNGIQYTDNNISVGFDAKTGQVTELRCSWDDNMKFPEAKTALTTEAATKIYFENFRPTLVYTSIMKPGTNQDPNKPAQYDIIAAYNLKNPVYQYMPGYIDAQTGKLTNYDGQEFKPQDDKFAQLIKGHKDEKILNILAFQNIIDRNSFKPDSEMKTVDFLRMMINAKGNYYYGNGELELKFTNIPKDSEYYRLLQQAVNMGMIENEAVKVDLSAKITREEIAEMLVKVMQYDKIAKNKDIFQLSYKDAKQISSDKFGAVAICKGLGIFGNEANFRPKANVTMAEAALAIYHAMANFKY